jgi:hypothetical protein
VAPLSRILKRRSKSSSESVRDLDREASSDRFESDPSPGVARALAVDDADPGAKDKSCALNKHIAGEAKRCHRVLQWMLDEHPCLARQLSVFYRHVYQGIPPKR